MKEHDFVLLAVALRRSAYCRVNVMRICDCNDCIAYLQRSKTEI